MVFVNNRFVMQTYFNGRHWRQIEMAGAQGFCAFLTAKWYDWQVCRDLFVKAPGGVEPYQHLSEHDPHLPIVTFQERCSVQENIRRFPPTCT